MKFLITPKSQELSDNAELVNYNEIVCWLQKLYKTFI